MRNLRQLPILFLTIALQLPDALAQQAPALAAGFHASVAFVETNNNYGDSRIGFQLAGNLAYPLTTGLSGLAELGVTTGGSHSVSAPLPCVLPGCTATARSNDTGFSVAPGLQWYTAGHTRRASFTLTPGVIWFASHPAGTSTLFPKLGGRFDLSWLAGTGLRLGLSAGEEYWGTDEPTLPSWVLTLGFTVGGR